MCFVVKEGMKELIATEDIVCWKLVHKKSDKGYGAASNYFEKEEDKFFYIPGVPTSKVELVIRLKSNPVDGYDTRKFDTIEEGYHSFIEKEEAEECRLDQDLTELQVRKFIIPKGTKYYANEGFGEYVSESIVMSPIRTKKSEKSCA